MGQERRNHRPLTRSPVIYRDDPVFKDARLEPFADQADDALVADPVFDEANQPFLTDRPEEVLDVGVCDPVHLPLVDRDVQGIQCIVRSSSGPEPVGETAEVAFIDGIEHHDRCTLNDLVFQSCHTVSELHSYPIDLWDRLKSRIRFIHCVGGGSSF